MSIFTTGKSIMTHDSGMLQIKKYLDIGTAYTALLKYTYYIKLITI